MVINSTYTKHNKGVRFLEMMKIVFKSKPRKSVKKENTSRISEDEWHEEPVGMISEEIFVMNIESETPDFIKRNKPIDENNQVSKSLMLNDENSQVSKKSTNDTLNSRE